MHIFRANVFKAWVLSVSIFIVFGIILCLAVADPIEVTDANDKTVVITSSERIVSLNGSTTEILFATIENGTLCGLVGPNGAGKSTLLRLISGELSPTTGEIRFFRKPIHNYPPKELARIRAYLQQKREVNFPFTSLEIALFGRHPYLNGRKETTTDLLIAKEALRHVEADMFTERLYPTLSGGEASRVDIARILAQAPDLFLLDEPTNHLDPRHQVQILNLFKTMCHQGKTVITAIHDLNLASMYADQLLLLKDGVSVACGLPKAVLTLDLLAEVYDIPFDILPHPNGYPWVMPSLKGS